MHSFQAYTEHVQKLTTILGQHSKSQQISKKSRPTRTCPLTTKQFNCEGLEVNNKSGGGTTYLEILRTNLITQRKNQRNLDILRNK